MRFLVALLSLDILVFVSSQPSSNLCPTWYVPDNSTNQCVCHGLKNWVICRETTKHAYIAHGFCMTFDNSTGGIDVGRCPYTIFSGHQKDGYTELPGDESQLNEALCGSWNREGYLCSRCKAEYGLAISNVYMSCVKCRYPKVVGWLFYFMLQLIPVTVLFFVVLFFRISIAHPPLNAYVTFCQISTALLYSYSNRFHPPFVIDSVFLRFVHRSFLVGLGLWGMDLIENISVISDFCVDSNINLQQAIALAQIKSLFPMLLVALTYTCIVLHTRNCKIIVCLWRPFQRCFASCSRVWNPRLSLVDVFSTFLLLSYSKYVMVLHFIYSFQHTHNTSNQQSSKSVLLYNPAVSYYDVSLHLPYALLLLFTLIVVAIPPVIFLGLYQIRLFQRFLTCFHLHKVQTIHIFVDRFQSYYKDGINKSRDLRFTASLYLMLRLSIFLGSVGCNYTSLPNCELFFMFALVFLLLLFFSLVRPYKNQRYNVLDSLLLAGLSIICFLLIGTKRKPENMHFNLAALIFILLIVGIPQAILVIYLFVKFINYLRKLRCCQSFVIQVKNKLKLKLNVELLTEMRSPDFTESLPDRVDHPYYANKECTCT